MDRVRKVNSLGGFSLIEVVVSIAIVGLLALGAYATIDTSIAMNGRTQAILEAETFTRTAVEELFSLGINPIDIINKNETDTEGHYDGYDNVTDITVTALTGYDINNTPYFAVTFKTKYGNDRHDPDKELFVTVDTYIKRAP